MRQFLRGERALTFARAAATAAVLAVFVTLALVAVSVRAQARDSQRIATQANAELARLRTVIAGRCEQRKIADRRAAALAVAVHSFAEALDRIVRSTQLPPGTPPDRVAAFRAEVRAIGQLRAQSAAVLASGVIGNCSQFTR